MRSSRRDLLKMAAGAALAGQAVPALAASTAAQSAEGAGGWGAVRELFQLSQNRIHMSAMLIASHPAPVREAIERHRAGLDADPVEYLEANDTRLTEAARAAAADYLGTHRSHIALTDSTTMGIGLVYAGLRLEAGDEIVTTEQDYFVTHEALRLAAARTGATVRRISLVEREETPDADSMVRRVVEAVTPSTRLVALTWVHSSTGLKIPAGRIGAALAGINAGRAENERVLFGLDAVHGFGIEDADIGGLGCDFYMAGCHKWLFGPRGTGIAAVSEAGLARLSPLVPSFDDPNVLARWIEGGDEPAGGNNGARLTPGGFKPFEHRWALAEAFDLHKKLGRAAVSARTHHLAGLLKTALAKVAGVTVRTPFDAALSAGIVSFDVAGASHQGVVAQLRRRGVIASVAPYARPYVRLTPSIVNSEDEVHAVAAALSEIV